MRNIFIFFAKLLYTKEYLLLKTKIENLNHQYATILENENLKILSKLLILAEDKRFNKHYGFDLIGILRAIRNYYFYKKIEGASTIEQQFVRVIINDYRRTISRKIKEILLATTITKLFPKKNIPLLYLMIAYYGNNLLGLENILLRFNLKMNSIIPIELAAEIIARIKYPERLTNIETQNEKISARKKYLINLYSKK